VHHRAAEPTIQAYLVACKVVKLGSRSLTEKTGTASAKPRKGCASTGASATASPTSAATVASIKICPSSAVAQIRDARFTMLPIAVYSWRPSYPMRPPVAGPFARPTPKPMEWPCTRQRAMSA
jgi:hypothetical protein